MENRPVHTALWGIADIPRGSVSKMGVNAVTTDRPGLLRQILAELPADAPRT